MSARLKIILAISLILNVFVVGLGIGLMVTGARVVTAAQAVHRSQVPPIWQAAERLPPAEREKFHQVIRAKAAEVQPELKAVRQARREAGQLMSQPNFDPKAAAAVLQRAREGEMHARAEIDTAFVEYLTHLPQEQRSKVAGAMMRNRPNALQRIQGQGDPADPAP